MLIPILVMLVILKYISNVGKSWNKTYLNKNKIQNNLKKWQNVGSVKTSKK